MTTTATQYARSTPATVPVAPLNKVGVVGVFICSMVPIWAELIKCMGIEAIGGSKALMGLASSCTAYEFV